MTGCGDRLAALLKSKETMYILNFLWTSFLLKIEGLLSSHKNYCQIISLSKNTGDLLFYKIYLRLSVHHFRSRCKGCFIFSFLPCQIKLFFVIFNCSTVKVGTFFFKARCTIFEIASELKITIFHSISRSLILHTFKSFLILAYYDYLRFFF